MLSKDIRAMFLDYFAARDHLVLPSFPLIPQNDPTLLLIGAGMAPLKPYFTGEKKPPHPRVATCQKCLRTPDIERVGLTGRHATFFEMLGNFSFGDYFKEEAIAWAWDLVTNGFRLPRERLWVTIYKDDEEAFTIWRDKIGVPENRITCMGEKDNFWEIGPGPCGPCSEIYYDLGPAAGCGKPDCAVGCDCDRFLEIWNLVFTQFNREPTGELTPLDKKNIDTGAGLERLAMALQGGTSLYDTDLVRPLYEHFARQAGKEVKEQTVPLRIMTEHCRGIVFMAADGVLPSNEGRGYVLRRLLRRAVRYGRLLDMEGNILTSAVPLVVQLMGDVYPELKEREEHIRQVIRLEENRFQETLQQGMEILEQYVQEMRKKNSRLMPGEWAFKLYDTYGFPLDLTREILEEKGLQVDEEAFREALGAQQERARLARAQTAAGATGTYREASGLTTLFTGYTETTGEGKVLLLLAGGKPVDAAAEGQEVEVFLDRTPFYAESGGQVGDSGLLKFQSEGLVKVLDTRYTPSGQIVHRGVVEKGALAQGEKVTAVVEAERREAVRRSHTATHLLHRSLKDLYGEHVNQAGSLVTADRLRFDFTHYAAPSPEELRQLEEQVNRLIMRNLPLHFSYTTLDEARQKGAVALFDEKYDAAKVRLVKIGDYSLELCGGTHVAATGEIGQFRIAGEESIGAGIRRIEAVTGMEAYRAAVEAGSRLLDLALALRSSPEHLEQKLRELLDEHRSLEKANLDLKQQLASFQVRQLLSAVKDVDGVKVLAAAVPADSADTLRMYLDMIRDSLPSAVVVMGAVAGDKVLLVGSVSSDLIKKGLKANDLVSILARRVGGGGGGRPDMAQAGGKNPAALPEALQSVEGMVSERLRQN